jgi:hypothetical protein
VGSGTGPDITELDQNFRQAGLRFVGDTDPTASIVDQPYINRNNARIGTLYDNSIRSANNIQAVGPSGQPIGTELQMVRNAIPTTLAEGDKRMINDAVDHVQQEFINGGGQISGDTYQGLTRTTSSTLSPLFNSDNPDVRAAARSLSGILLPRARAAMTPAQNAMYDQANNQYRALQTVQDATDSTGAIAPDKLYTASRAAADKYGPGQMDDFAAAGNSLVQPMLSGRSPGWRQALTTAGAGTGLALGPAYAAAQKLLALNLLGLGVPAVAGGGGVIGLNRALQTLNQASGPAAVRTVLGGGGRPSVNMQGLLGPAVSAGVGMNQQQ